MGKVTTTTRTAGEPSGRRLGYQSTPTAPRTRTTILRDWQARAAAESRLSMLAVPVKPQPPTGFMQPETRGDGLWAWVRDRVKREWHDVVCPFRVGDMLIGRERWAWTIGNRFVFSADDPSDASLLRWNSPQTMPNSAARFRFTVKSIAVPRTTDLTGAQAKACGIIVVSEGHRYHPDAYRSNNKAAWQPTAVMALAERWDRDYPAFPFASSPWIWLIGVERIGGTK